MDHLHNMTARSQKWLSIIMERDFISILLVISIFARLIQSCLWVSFLQDAVECQSFPVDPNRSILRQKSILCNSPLALDSLWAYRPTAPPLYYAITNLFSWLAAEYLSFVCRRRHVITLLSKPFFYKISREGPSYLTILCYSRLSWCTIQFTRHKC